MKMNREEELFIVFQEECGEAVQAISKMFRFGKTDMNVSNIETEIGDLFGVFKLLIEVISTTKILWMLVNARLKR